MQYEDSDAPILEIEDGAVAAVRRGHPCIAWLVIIVLAGGVTYLQNGGRNTPHPLEDSGTSPQDVIMLLQGRYLVGAAKFAGNQRAMLYDQAEPLNHGTVEQRLRFAVLAEELAGPQRALDVLSDLENRILQGGVELDDEQQKLLETETTLMTDYADGEWDAPSLDQSQRELLKEKLGWFGDLALAPKKGSDAQARASVMRAAEQTAISLLGTAGLYCLLLMVGVMALVVFGAAYLSGSTTPVFRCGAASRAGVYPETFVVWLILFFLLTQGASLLVQNERYRTLALAAAMFCSLLALVWPRLRGISWRDIRSDIGWTAGRGPLVEPLFGVGSYVMTIPILFVGFLACLALMLVAGLADPLSGGADDFSPTGLPSHPIISTVANADWFVVVQLYLAAAVAAPVVEETMFRGVMYRQLRESSARWGFWASFLFSAFVNAFIFAVIHPQGFIAVPALVAIALGLTMAREWRGTLIPSMVAHGIHNGLLMTVLLLAIGR